MFFELVGFAIPVFGIGRLLTFHGDIGPFRRVLCVDLKPFFQARLSIRFNCLCGTLGFANTAVNAFIWVDDEHILAFVKAIDRADLNTVHIFALDAVIGHQIGHFTLRFRLSSYQTFNPVRSGLVLFLWPMWG